MKRLISLLAVCVFMFPLFATNAYAVGLDYVTAKSYIIMDAQTGEVVAERNMDEKAYPASITKIMTIALALETYDGDKEDMQNEWYTATKSAAYVPYKSTAIYLQPGEKITMWDALMATEIKSANDAANALAEITYGSMEDFVEAMNQKAEELGCQNTHFSNTHGYHEDNHYTSAHDIALITKWALTVPYFQEIFSTLEYTIPATEYFSERHLTTQNLMAEGQKFAYPGLIGGKSGWTDVSGYTQVEVAQRNEKTYIAVVMDSDGFNQKFYDCSVMLDIAFAA